jgi:catalase
LNAAGSKPLGFGHGDAGWAVEGIAGRYDARGSEDDTTQAGNPLPHVQRPT